MSRIISFGAGALAGGLAVLAGLWRRLQRLDTEREALTARVHALDRAVEAAEKEAAIQHKLADRRRAELSTAQARLEQLEAGMDALKQRGAEDNVQAKFDARLMLFEHLSSVLVQMPSVAHAVESGADLGARDVLALMKPLEQAMVDMGFAQIGAPGEEAAFDPTVHQGAAGLEAGQKVRIKFVGYRYGDQILRRAQVTPA